MSRGIVIKFLAFVLAAITFLTAGLSVLGIVVLSYQNLYDSSFENLRNKDLESHGRFMAYAFAERYAAQTLGNCPESLLTHIYGSGFTTPEDTWSISLHLDGETLTTVGDIPEGSVSFAYEITGTYPSLVLPEGGKLRRSDVAADDKIDFPSSIWEIEEDGQQVSYTLYHYDMPSYSVTVHLHPDTIRSNDWELLELLHAQRYHLIVYAAISILIFSVCIVTLCCTAGKTPGSEEIRPGGVNRLPLDLYACIVGVIGVPVAILGVHLADWTFNGEVNYGGIILCCILALVLCVLVLAFFFALAAQIKYHGGYWWRNSVLGRCLLALGRGLRWAGRGLARLFSLLPVIWQWLVTATVMALAFFLAILGLLQSYQAERRLWALLVIAVCFGVVCYGGYAFGTLLSGVIRMNKGELDHKIPEKYLFGAFRDFAVALNGVSESAVAAAQKHLKSERMKTELITNVSHDIKTPLTSIINYVDLLQKSHTEEERRLYLDVLSRQSLRLKRLIEDLMEMSRASTGNITVNTATLNAVEAVNQALGEFSGKLTAARLTPVFAPPEEPVNILADGRLVWRVLSNLLSNAVKYALPETRVYIDVIAVGERVQISIKNISKEPLNIDSEELMERFVRGDASRNSEGSGLGLNIAKSLMELQKGELSLLVDGDLFKVTLYFPKA